MIATKTCNRHSYQITGKIGETHELVVINQQLSIVDRIIMSFH